MRCRQRYRDLPGATGQGQSSPQQPQEAPLLMHCLLFCLLLGPACCVSAQALEGLPQWPAGPRGGSAGGPWQGWQGRAPPGHDAVHALAFGPRHLGAVFGGCEQDQFGELSGLPGGCRDDFCAWLGDGSWPAFTLSPSCSLGSGRGIPGPRACPSGHAQPPAGGFLLLPGKQPGVQRFRPCLSWC